MKCQFLLLVPWVLIFEWFNDIAEVKQMCVIHVWMLCYKMWSRNFIPDYGIQLLSCYLLLSTLAARIPGVEGKSSFPVVMRTGRAYESAVCKVTRPRWVGSAARELCIHRCSSRTGRLIPWFSQFIPCETSRFKNWSEVNASHFLMFFNCAAFVDVKLSRRVIRNLSAKTSVRLSCFAVFSFTYLIEVFILWPTWSIISMLFSHIS